MLSLASRSQLVSGKASERPSFRTQATAGLRKAPAHTGLDRSRRSLQTFAKRSDPKKNGSGAKGFGARSPAASTPKPVSSFTLLTKDELATAHEYFLFARKPDGRWLPIGDISVKDSKDAPDAIKERRGVLVEYTERRYMALKCLKKGESIEFGYRLQRGSSGPTEIQAVNIDGKVERHVAGTLQLLQDVGKHSMSKEQMLQDAVAQMKKQEMNGEAISTSNL